MSRIAILDLPETQDLTESELQNLYGAGRPRTLSRDFAPGIIQMAVLEQRQFFSATGATTTASTVAAAIPGSSVTKDASGNTIYSQTVNGKETVRALFSPSGQPVSFDRTSGDVRVHAEFTNGVVTVEETYVNNVRVIRQEFSSAGKLTREVGYDDKGAKAVETVYTNTTRQVTEYVGADKARVRHLIDTAQKTVVVYEETWKGKTCIATTWNNSNGFLDHKWVINGDYRITTTVPSQGVQEVVTEFKDPKIANSPYVAVSRVQHSNQESLKQAFAAELAKYTIQNSKAVSDQITALAKTPILQKTWGTDGKPLRTETITCALKRVATVQPGKQTTYTLSIDTTKTTTSVMWKDGLENRATETLFNGVVTESRLVVDGKLQRRSVYNTKGQQLSQVDVSGKQTVTTEFTPVSGKPSYPSRRTVSENGFVTREETFNATGMTRRTCYANVNGVSKVIFDVIVDGTNRKEIQYLGKNQRVEISFAKEKEVLRNTYENSVLVQSIERYANEIKKMVTVVSGPNKTVINYDDKGIVTKQTLSVSGKTQVVIEYQPGTGKPLKMRVQNANEELINSTTWEYKSDGSVVKMSRDFQAKGTQEVQRKVWVNKIQTEYFVWSWNSGQRINIVWKKWEHGKLTYDREQTPSGKMVKENVWWITRRIDDVFKGTWKYDAIPSPTNIDKTVYNVSGDAMVYVDPDDPIETSLWLGKYGGIASLIPSSPPDPGTPQDILVGAMDVVTGGNGQEVYDSMVKAYNDLISAELPAIEDVTSWIDNTTGQISGAVDGLMQTMSNIKAGLEKANDILKNQVSESLQRLQRTVNQIDKVVSTASMSAKTTYDDAKSTATSAANTVNAKVATAATAANSASNEVSATAQTITDKGKKAWADGKAAVGTAVKDLKGVLAQEIIAYQVDSGGKLTFNLQTGGYYAGVELVKGVTLDTERLRDWMNGKMTLPEVTPVTAAASLVGLKTDTSSDYEAVRNSEYTAHGGANVYFSSSRFADWAGPQTLARLTALTALGGTVGANQTLAEVKSYLQLELQDLATWLQQKGAEQAPRLAVQILSAIANQSDLSLPELELKIMPVTYTHKISSGLLGGSQSVSESHVGFSIVWRGALAGDPLLGALNQLDSKKLTGGFGNFSDLALTALGDLPLSKELTTILTAVLSGGAAGVESTDAFDKIVIEKLSEILGLSQADLLKMYQTGNPLIDLTSNDTIRRKFQDTLDDMAQGNQKSSEIKKLVFNVSTMSFEADIVLHHKHSWGSLAEMGNGVVKQLT